jgi:hypothetical protein
VVFAVIEGAVVVSLTVFEAAVPLTEVGAVGSLTGVEEVVPLTSGKAVAPLTEVAVVVAFSVMGEAVLVGVSVKCWVGEFEPRGVNGMCRLDGGDDSGDEEGAS